MKEVKDQRVVHSAAPAIGLSCNLVNKHIDTPRSPVGRKVCPVVSSTSPDCFIQEGEFLYLRDTKCVRIQTPKGSFYLAVTPYRTTLNKVLSIVSVKCGVPVNKIWNRYGFKVLTEKNFGELSEGFHPDQTPINIYYSMIGGSTCPLIQGLSAPLLDTQYIIHESERMLCSSVDRSNLRLQSLDTTNLMALFKRLVEPYKKTLSEYLIKLLEDLIILGYDINKSKSFSDYLFAITTFAKLRTPKSLTNTALESNLVEYFVSLFKGGEVELQSSIDLGGLLDHFESFKKSKMWSKLYKLFNHVITGSILQHLGLPFSTEQLSKLKSFVLAQQLWRGADFLSIILDTCLFIYERGILFVRTGDMSSFVHSDVNYIKWRKDVEKLKLQFHQLNDPEHFGFTESQFIADLEAAIDVGKNIKKHSTKLNDIERRMASSTLNELQFKHCEFLSARRARENRRAPFSILIDGDSSVGKSTITNLLFYHFGKLFNLPIGDEYKYSKNPVAKYWDGFRSSMWCLQLDDVSFMNPNKASEGDPSVMEIIQVVNNVPYVPDQAALEDKGKVPLRCEFCIATTNTDHLNAHAYFSCPVAVRRRLPWVIRCEVKPQYATNEGMLDASKTEGDTDPYPNYWVWHVQKVRPVREAGQTRYKQACLEKIASFDDVYEFLGWFNSTAKSFRETQDLVCDRQEKLRNVDLCDHGIPRVKCRLCPKLQAEATVETAEWTKLPDHLEVAMVKRAQKVTDDHMPTWQIRNDIISEWKLMSYWNRFYNYMEAWCIMKFVFMFLWMYNSNSIIFFLWMLCLRCTRFIPFIYLLYDVILYRMYYDDRTWRKMADKVRFFGLNKKRILCAVAGITAVYGAYKLYKLQQKKKRVLNGGVLSKAADSVAESISARTGNSPILDKNPIENPWTRDHYELSPIDLTPAITSAKGLGLGWLVNKIERNVIRLEFRFITDHDTVRVFRVCAVGLKGFEYIFNTHCIPDIDDESRWTLRVYFKKPEELLDPCVDVPMKKSMLRSIENTDLTLLTFKYIPPCKDITSWLPQASMRGQHKGVLITRTSSGSITKRDIANVRFEANAKTPLMNMDLWTGYSDTQTVVGDCGSALILETPQGPVFAGIHVLGSDDGIACSIALNQDIVKYLKSKISDGPPTISAPSAEREITDLHFKSTARYLQRGQAVVYGSFTGFRPRHKSKVSQTLICPIMLQRGYSIKQGPPVMSGWEPWRIALLEMTHRENKWDLDIIEKVKQSYLNDIITHKDFTEEIKKVQVYDNITAVNGAPGVAYVDKINRNTSAGNPWKKSKKFFMRKVDYEGYTEAVMFDDEIMDRVDDIINKYHKGQRYAPVFCGHLKDEAVSFKKINAKKTRVFSGAPVDWSIVVRKYLLSVIRMMQGNKYMFECAPGTVAQSLEWTQMYNYITQFGDNIIAGDYASYDKSMLCIFILAAFDILIEICKLAQYTEADVMVLEGIKIDTAYAWMDFNGDLMQFFGSNPSGHPLTVIINCIVNSLYMRYAYYILNPLKECSTFRLCVALMTYGDDNIAGVAKDKAPWFNHTSISKVFASVGVTYTMADKETESIPYISMKDATFLKRSWRWDEQIGAYTCPLEHDSINKMLTMTVQSKTLCPEAHSIEVINSACREYFFYGREIFEQKRKMFQEVIIEANIVHYQKETTLPSWKSLKDDFLSYPVDVNCF